MIGREGKFVNIDKIDEREKHEQNTNKNDEKYRYIKLKKYIGCKRLKVSSLYSKKELKYTQ